MKRRKGKTSNTRERKTTETTKEIKNTNEKGRKSCYIDEEDGSNILMNKMKNLFMLQ